MVPLSERRMPSGIAATAEFPVGTKSVYRHYKTIAVLAVWVALGLGLAAAPSARAQTLTTLYSFCALDYCTDGFWPQAGLMQGSNGNLYGTTSCGGTNLAFGATCNGAGGGTIFEITPGGAFTTLYDFCAQEQCADGQYPAAALIQGSDGGFYGTTAAGGAGLGGCFLGDGCGTVFKVTPDGALTTLYSFCSLSGCVDGATPLGSLVMASDGNLYGTTASGGANGQGTVFKIAPGGALTTLYSFCAGRRLHERSVSLRGSGRRQRW